MSNHVTTSTLKVHSSIPLGNLLLESTGTKDGGFIW